MIALKMNSLFFCIFGLIGASVGHYLQDGFDVDQFATRNPVVFPGQCDLNTPTAQNFNASAYMGLWYVLENYPSTSHTGTCNKALYSLTPQNTVTVTNTQVIGQRLHSMTATGTLAADGSGKLDVIVNTPNGGQVISKSWVLDTDYTSYSLVYSCRNRNAQTREILSWKFSRQPTFTPEAEAAINAVIDRIDVLDQRYYLPRSHSAEDCFYFPDN